MIFQKRKQQLFFDDVASDEIKALRAAIFAAADRALIAAAKQAVLGNAKGADERRETARILRWQAINIPLDMVERGIDPKELGTAFIFDRCRCTQRQWRFL